MPIHDGSPKRARLLGVGLLALMFVAGGLSGMAMTQVLVAKETPAAGARDGSCRDGERRQKIIDQLDLRPEQRARVDRILERRREQTELFWDSASPRLRTLTDSARAEIRAVLDPAQRAEYDRLREERKRQHELEKARDGDRDHHRGDRR